MRRTYDVRAVLRAVLKFGVTARFIHSPLEVKINSRGMGMEIPPCVAKSQIISVGWPSCIWFLVSRC